MTAHNEKNETNTGDTPTPTIDYEEFAHFFEGEDITEEGAREFLQVYWSLALEVMSLGFGFHPVQQAQNTCGKLPKTDGEPRLEAPPVVYLDQNDISENFENTAGPATDRKGKESIHDVI